MDKVLFIVGMGPGLSAAVARRFARDGYAVGAVARDAEKLEAQLSVLRASGARIAGATADAGDAGSLRQAMTRLQAELGDADVLVYNAAGVTYRPLAELTAEQFAADLAVSVTGALTAAQCVLTAMRARGSGSVLLTGGGFAFEPMPALASLGAGKAAIRNLAFSLHADLKDIGVHAATVTICGTVAPGTPFDPDRIAEAYWQLHAQPAEAFEREVQFRG
ncbi:MAG TPA: SDR family NAD(P)-dependent oxidoreductase [Burkholderiaceae bacterium]|nr:SDR family NAD(P)-dependent oxidoreductase [Burkholderiaceae bacterium]